MTLYTVWNNHTDELVILDGTKEQCAKAMGVSVNCFYSHIGKILKGKVKKWSAEKISGIKGYSAKSKGKVN